MNKLVKVLAASALAATVLVGCKKEAPAGATYAKAGLGVVTSMGHYDPTEVNTTFAAVGLDAEGKINYMDLDVAQGTPVKNELDKTKKERGADYAMKSQSGIQKEWDEQAKAFEEFCKGKTLEEIKAIEMGEDGKGTDADLTAGCTIAIGDMVGAVIKAVENAQDVNADKLALGRAMVYEKDYGKEENEYLTTELALVATDKDGKIVKIDLETSKNKNDGSVLETKTELKDKYDMKKASQIGKEWYEQTADLESKLVGKTVEEAAKIADESGYAADADIKAGCTINLFGFTAAIAKAK